jgi:hypothetical protein
MEVDAGGVSKYSRLSFPFIVLYMKVEHHEYQLPERASHLSMWHPAYEWCRKFRYLGLMK